MSTVAEYTLSEMILLAAGRLEEQGQSPFSAEDLIVAAWRQFPRAFGLKGYAEQYPDSNRILSSIMGERGLARKGWLQKMGQKLYTLSKDGQRMVRRIAEGAADTEADDEPATPRLPREQEKLLVGMLESAATKRFSERRAYELGFADACAFWHITKDLAGEALDGRMELVEKTLNQAARLASKSAFHAGHKEVAKVDVDLLRETHEHLNERFSRHLMLLKSRAR